jgi:predicted nucleic acid-binding protein
VALDTNVLILGLEKGYHESLVAALRGRSPVVSETAREEYLVGDAEESLSGGQAALLSAFLLQFQGRIAGSGNTQRAQDLVARGREISPVARIDLNDGLIADAAREQGIPLITYDKDLVRLLEAQQQPVELFAP